MSLRRESWPATATAYLLVTPFLGTLLIFGAYPLARSLILSFQQTFGPSTARWVGLANYQRVLVDPLFWTAVRTTCWYAAGALLLQLPLSLGLAMWLNRPEIRGRRWFRLALFSPSLVGVAFAAVLFAPLFDKNTGAINRALHALWSGWNLEYPWLERHVLAALILISLWLYVGFNMIYFLAALQNVDPLLNDAARIDGASSWQRFRHVTWPAIRHVAGFVALLSLIGSFQVFELPYVLLNFSGGPENRGLTLVTYLYQIGFESADLGYASAIGWCLAAVLISMAWLQHCLLRGRD